MNPYINIFYTICLLICLLILFILPFLIFILHFIIIKWTYELEKEGCDCSNLWHRNIIKYYAIILLSSFFVVLLFNFLGIFLSIPQKLKISGILFNIIKFLRVITFTILIIYLGTIIDYIINLKKLECLCSEDWKKKYAYFTSISYLLVLIIIIISIFLLYNFDNKMFRTFYDIINKQFIK